MNNEPFRIDYKDKPVMVLMGEGMKYFFMEKEPGMLVPVDQYGFILFKEEFEKLIRGADSFFTKNTESQISRHNDSEQLELFLFVGMDSNPE